MAQLAIGIGGGILGSFVGMPQLGFMAGSLVGGMLFPNGTAGGPKLTDLHVTASTYGVAIPKGYGTKRDSGNLIWSTDLQPHEQGGKGGLLGSPTYTYTVTAGFALCSGPIVDVIRVWADGKIIFDKTGQSTQDEVNFNLNGGGQQKGQQFYQFSYRLYKGTEEQLPDPALEAFVGTESALAHRGTAVIVLDNFPLQAFGERIPNLEFETVYSSPSGIQAFIARNFDIEVDGSPATSNGDRAFMDLNRGRAYFITTIPAGLAYCDRVTGDTIFGASDTEIFTGFPAWEGLATDSQVTLGYDGNLYMGSGTTNSDPIFRVDGDALICTGQFGTANSSVVNQASGFCWTTQMVPLQVYGSNLLACVSIFNEVGVFNTDTMSVTSPGKPFSIPNTDHEVYIGPGPTGNNLTTSSVFKIGTSVSTSDPLNIYRIDVAIDGSVTQTQIGQLTPAQVNASWSNITAVSGLAYDGGDGNFIFGVATTDTVPVGVGSQYIIKYSATGGDVLWAAPVNHIPNQGEDDNEQGDFSRAAIVDGEYAFIGNEAASFNGAGDHSPSGFVGLYTIQTFDGAYTRADWPITFAQAQTYDGTTGAVLYYGTLQATYSTNQWLMIYTDRAAAAAVPLGDVVTDICGQVGLTPADIDVTDLDGINVEGYVLNRQVSAKSALDPLTTAFTFDGVESDNVFKFIERGHDSIGMIAATDLAVIDTKLNSLSKETRIQEVDLPSVVHISYLDSTRDYQQSTQYSKRSAVPVPTMRSKNYQTVNLELVSDPDFMRQLADKLLYTAWAERTSYEVKLPWEYLIYDPTDILTLQLSDDSENIVRLVSTDVGGNLQTEVRAVSESAATYSSDSLGNPGGNFTSNISVVDTTTVFTLLDMPLARDLDDTGETSTIIYYSGAGYSSKWSGMEVYKSADGSAYADEHGVTKGSTWGVVISPPADTSHPFRTDRTNTIIIRPMFGEFSSITYLQLCNGANGCALVNTSTGVVEIVQFQTATVNTDGSVTLSTLLRGRRGSEDFTGGHVAGERVFMLSDSNGQVGTGISNVPMALSDTGVLRFFKGVPLGTPIAGTAPVLETDTGKALAPYAPTHIQVVTSGSDLALTWRRRTRVAGQLRDGTGTVPLSELDEHYQVDVYDALGTTVLRTLDQDYHSTVPQANPGVTYLAADITTDFGSTPTSLNLKVYQIGTLGRGFSKMYNVIVDGRYTP